MWVHISITCTGRKVDFVKFEVSYQHWRHFIQPTMMRSDYSINLLLLFPISLEIKIISIIKSLEGNIPHYKNLLIFFMLFHIQQNYKGIIIRCQLRLIGVIQELHYSEIILIKKLWIEIFWQLNSINKHIGLILIVRYYFNEYFTIF